MKSTYWNIFSETGDALGYLLCRAAENALASSGDEAASGGRGGKTGENEKPREKRESFSKRL